MENDEKVFIRCGGFISRILRRKRRLSTLLQVCLEISLFVAQNVRRNRISLNFSRPISSQIRTKIEATIPDTNAQRSPFICQISNSSVHESLKFEIAGYKTIICGHENSL